LILCGCGSQNRYGGYGNMSKNCCCCCCEQPKFKKCRQTVYIPECGFGNMGYGNMGYGNQGYGNQGFDGGCGFGNGSWWWIIIILLFCCNGNNGFGNCGNFGNC
ncbi:MAG: hypothetical protein E6789_07320, partial [Clostridium baratii]|nr:hypothetical protein [Clostridium baratii]